MMIPIGGVPVQTEFIKKASLSFKKKLLNFYFLIKTLSTPDVTPPVVTLYEAVEVVVYMSGCLAK